MFPLLIQHNVLCIAFYHLHDRLFFVIMKLTNALGTKIDQFYMSSRNDAKERKVMTIVSSRDISN
jgi:hypothetical protein